LATVVDQVLLQRGAPDSITVNIGRSSPARRWTTGFIAKAHIWTSACRN